MSGLFAFSACKKTSTFRTFRSDAEAALGCSAPLSRTKDVFGVSDRRLRFSQFQWPRRMTKNGALWSSNKSRRVNAQHVDPAYGKALV
eukprot:4712067-Pleurochrysis_carterae.AAC.6